MNEREWKIEWHDAEKEAGCGRRSLSIANEHLSLISDIKLSVVRRARLSASISI